MFPEHSLQFFSLYVFLLFNSLPRILSSFATWLNPAHAPRPSTRHSCINHHYTLLSILLEEKSECVLSLLGTYSYFVLPLLQYLLTFALQCVYCIICSLLLLCKFLWGLCYTWEAMEIDKITLIQTEGFGEQRGPSWHLKI